MLQVIIMAKQWRRTVWQSCYLFNNAVCQITLNSSMKNSPAAAVNVTAVAYTESDMHMKLGLT